LDVRHWAQLRDAYGLGVKFALFVCRVLSGAMNLAFQRPEGVCRTPPPMIRYL